MAEQPSQPSASGFIWRNGLIFGGIYAVIEIVDVAIEWANGSFVAAAHASANASGNLGAVLSNLGPSAYLGCLFFLVFLALTFVAGMQTSRQVGRVGSGSLTGLVAGLFGALLGGIASLIAQLVVVVPATPLPAAAAGTMTESQYHSFVIISTIVISVLVFLFYGGLGAGLGALGGLVGRSNYQKAHPAPAYEQSFYGGLPAYPPAPGYPLPQGAYPPPPPPAPGYPPAPPTEQPQPPTQQ